MKTMFQECNELEYLDLSNFNTSNVIEMGWMFNECLKLKEIKGIYNFNTSKVVNMNSMFQECYELEYLDLSNFDTSNVTSMEAMFNQCNKLKEIKGINNFVLDKVKNKKIIFDGCNNLKDLSLSKFNVMIENKREKLIYILFHLDDYKFQCFIPCYISDSFTTLEEKLYGEYPEFKNKQMYFTVNGNIINKSKKKKKNGIKSSDNILINYY